ncbi:MAG: hypothetical protein Q7R49_00060, partial [Candidatus Daviesbacteria bacterium]|nr:hypothetical protein [Candidatus Daviesbacteria bacterium]
EPVRQSFGERTILIYKNCFTVTAGDGKSERILTPQPKRVSDCHPSFQKKVFEMSHFERSEKSDS